MPSDPSSRRQLLFAAIVAAFVLLVIELAGQAAYRLTAGAFLWSRGGAPIFEADPTRCYRLKPNLAFRHRTNEFDITLYTDAQGLRSDASRRELPVEKPEGVTRILFLGPSFALGWGSEYEEAYATRVGELLRASGQRVEILNLGTPAQGVAPQLCWLAQVGRLYRPDLVVQTLYGDRVPSVAGGCPEHLDCPVVEDGWLYSVKPTPARRVVAWLKQSAILFYGFYAYQWVVGVTPANEQGTGKELHDPESLRRKKSYEELASDFARYEDTVRQALGPEVRSVFLFIPLSFVVHPEDAPRWRHLADPDPVRTREGIHRDVTALQAAGHTIVDASEALIAARGAERLYYWLDIHLTPEGNRVVAEALLPVLREQLEASRS